MYDIDAMPGFLFLGNEGEGGAGPDVVTIDVSAWVERWPSGVFAVTYTRPGDDTVYPEPAGNVSVLEGVLTWLPSGAILAYDGSGTVSFRCVEGSSVKKSVTAHTVVAPSHTSYETAPEPITDWINSATALLAGMADGASIVDAAFVGDDLVFTRDDAETITLIGAKTALTGATGAEGAQGPEGPQGATGSVEVGTLAEARTLTIGDTGKSFDGSADVAWTLAEIGAAPKVHGTHVAYSLSLPQPLGTPSPGQHPYASRADHVHPLPSLSALGALPRTGSGAPSASAAYIGQLYVDTAGKIGHIAVSVGAGANDWKRVTNA